MKFIKQLFLSISLFGAILAAPAQADQTFDWTSTSFGTYQIQYLGWYDDGVVSGNQYSKTVTRTSFAYVNPPANPFPANLPHLQSSVSYVLNGSNQVILASPLTATLWNDTGDSLFATGATLWTSGPNYSNLYQFTGGTGAFAGAYGTWLTQGTVLANFQQTWNSEAHLVIPGAIPEPETYAMLLAGLGLMGAVARRRKKAMA